jgi:hypothetical protein
MVAIDLIIDAVFVSVEHRQHGPHFLTQWMG